MDEMESQLVGRPWRAVELPDSDEWRERTTGNTQALACLEQIRLWVDRGWPRDVTNEQWTNLAIDLGEIRETLLATLDGRGEPELVVLMRRAASSLAKIADNVSPSRF